MKNVVISLPTGFESLNPSSYSKGDIDLPSAKEYEGELTEEAVLKWTVDHTTMELDELHFVDMGEEGMLVDAASTWYVFKPAMA